MLYGDHWPALLPSLPKLIPVPFLLMHQHRAAVKVYGVTNFGRGVGKGRLEAEAWSSVLSPDRLGPHGRKEGEGGPCEQFWLGRDVHSLMLCIQHFLC